MINIKFIYNKRNIHTDTKENNYKCKKKVPKIISKYMFKIIHLEDNNKLYQNIITQSKRKSFYMN